jgi:murein DD-endopeptidase MepM/ murein hydrolase activator NlpD
MYRGDRHRVRASHSGKVVYAGWNAGYGRLVVIWHMGLKYTAYGHLDSISIRNQQRVKAGQTIGRQGQTGDATGSHLHYEVWNGGWYKKVNAGRFMRARGIRLGWCR